MYLPVTGDDLFHKHRDGCGNIANHIHIVGVTEQQPLYDGNSEEPYAWICDIDMIWEGSDETYTYPDVELEDPDDWDAAKEYVVSQVR